MAINSVGGANINVEKPKPVEKEQEKPKTTAEANKKREEDSLNPVDKATINPAKNAGAQIAQSILSSIL